MALNVTVRLFDTSLFGTMVSRRGARRTVLTAEWAMQAERECRFCLQCRAGILPRTSPDQRGIGRLGRPLVTSSRPC
jgi:hypothetical protein